MQAWSRAAANRSIALPKHRQAPILVVGLQFGSTSVPGAYPASARDDGQRRWHVAASAWLPAALLGAGVLLGVALWARWGFAIAFEAIRTYCF
jgi:hypothetical protein